MSHIPSEIPPLPTALTDFLIARTPDKRIGITAIGTDHLKNGAVTELAKICLNEQEKLQFETYTFQKRRQQWLLGRVCAKQSVLKLLDCGDDNQQLTPADIAVSVAPNGRPFLGTPANDLPRPIPDISISHSEHRVIALAANGYCGIDIQALSDTLFKVKDRFCSEQENTMLHSAIDAELEQLGLLWAAKEAVRKCFSDFRTIGFLAMKLSGIEHGESCTFLKLQLDESCAGVDEVIVAAATDNRYCLGACIVPREADHA